MLIKSVKAWNDDTSGGLLLPGLELLDEVPGRRKRPAVPPVLLRK
jgi:hypothetical protein